MRTWIEQPKGTRICGQIAIAVITNIKLENVIRLLGKNGISTKKLAKALRLFGYKCPSRCRKMKRPPLAIAQAHRSDFSGWHWVAIEGDKIFDGLYGTPDGKVDWGKWGWRITSYLPIKESKYNRHVMALPSKQFSA